MTNENGSYFLVGLFAGVCLGGMGALLLAPESGERLRRDLRKGGRRLVRKASEAVEDLRDRGDDAVEATRHTLQDVTADVKSKIQRG